ncbi:FAS1-like dehydratase domain-containing protein [Parapusillimonas granuli]|uniref:MaoC family dehydratase N-terminal domain-containing protein n=1 Tax=Parapusillimonas granuli TaxID=380911 RepID=A0A853FS46_9BURK|nr:MaoC family dehydratase N-terminal domain-containing protein [Parapusillimonas granuli]MBB5213830.1 itaconyl-CoA hydratase/mesaconyl-C4 CoA hydratase [Parapusillimonas granuli]NYT48665.1 MaoC family dehydratase N-terminal domain-containing protein [Parapusillimonas granuli]
MTQELDAWVGRSDRCDDNIDPGHIKKVALTLDAPCPAPGEALPLLWHWALFVNAVPHDEIGEDGHPRRGGFLPPADDRNRMWAGGRLEFLAPLRVGVPAARESRIAAIQEKEGRTGKLLFVTVKHEYFQGGALCISEEQDIVYREPAAPKLQGTVPAPEAQWSERVHPDHVMLFRYSAVTFNGHRIHYDQDYAMHREGYPGLVVHGPMIATLQCRAFTRAHPEKQVAAFSYRGLRPLIAPRDFRVEGALTGADSAALWAQQDGMVAHQSELRFRP